MDLSKITTETHDSKTDGSLKITKVNIPTEISKPIHTLFISDVHTDAPNCDRKLLFDHLEAIKRNNGLVFVIGDMWDVMQTRYDPRRSRDGMREEDLLTEEAYLDSVIDNSLKFYDKYKDNIVFIGRGNHEDVITKNSGTNITRRFIKEINRENSHSNTAYGSYSGIIVLNFYTQSNNKCQYAIYYHHGFGGNAKRSKGVLNIDLNEAFISGVRMFVSGHDHNKWHMPRDKFRLNGNNTDIEVVDVQHMKLGSYLSRNDWATSKGFENTRRGGYFVNFTMNRAYRVMPTVIEANEVSHSLF